MKKYLKARLSDLKDGLIILLVLAIGFGLGTFVAERGLQMLNRREARAAEAAFIKYQDDLIKQYKLEKPDSKPETHDFPAAPPKGSV